MFRDIISIPPNQLHFCQVVTNSGKLKKNTIKYDIKILEYLGMNVTTYMLDLCTKTIKHYRERPK